MTLRKDMGKISDETIKKVKEAANVVDVLQDCDVALHKRGVNYVALCPFHNDKTLGNFVVSPTKNVYKCFACGKSGDSLRYLMDHEHMKFVEAIKWLGQKYSIEVEGAEDVKVEPRKMTKAVARIPEKPKPILILPMSMVTAREDTSGDTLCNWLRSLPWGPMQRETLERVLKDYHVGHSKDEKTIWWQIDYQGQVRTGKLMKYKTDGHRDRDDKNSFDWIHNRLKKARYWSESDKQMETCLFGIHLAKAYPKATVNIVESEKTAVIMAIAYGNPSNNIWLATGGMSFLSRSKLAPLIEGKRRILLYPDQDGIEKWRAKMKEIGYQNMRLAKSLVIDPDNPKKDCGDFIIEKLNEIQANREKKARGEERLPAVEELERYDREQCKLLDMIKDNPAIDQLIAILELEILY